MPDVIPLLEATPNVNPGDPATRVRVLSSILEELGITDVLAASKRLLQREQELTTPPRGPR